MAITVTATPASLVSRTAAYSADFVVSGHAGPVAWSVTGVPPDFVLTVINDTTVRLSAPVHAGRTTRKYSPSVKADDGTSAGSKSFTLFVADPPVLTGTPKAIAQLNKPYLGFFGVTGGIRPFAWSIGSGSMPLPTGCSFTSDSGITGTPTVTGNKTGIKMKLTDAAGQTVTSNTFSINVTGAAQTLTGKIRDAAAVGGGGGDWLAEGSAYQLDARAGAGSGTGYTWALAAGSSLPSGMGVASNGQLSGTPAVGSHGDYTYALTVTDSLGATFTTESRTLHVYDPNPFAISALPDTSFLVGGTYVMWAYANYSATFSLVGTTVPGLIMEDTGAMHGTVTTVGVYEGVVVRATRVSDGAVVDSPPFTITIYSPADRVSSSEGLTPWYE